jgi:hypothetical protein
MFCRLFKRNLRSYKRNYLLGTPVVLVGDPGSRYSAIATVFVLRSAGVAEAFLQKRIGSEEAISVDDRL